MPEDVPNDKVVTFIGSISQSKNAISFGDNGIRAQFDIPETDCLAANKLTALRNTVLKITIEVVQDEKVSNKNRFRW